MKTGQVINFLNVNRSVTNIAGSPRHFRLPDRNSSPKLDLHRVRMINSGSDECQSEGSTSIVASPTVVARGSTRFPEMTMDSLDSAPGICVKNVKLGRSTRRFFSLFGICSWFRLRTDVHRATRVY